MLEIVQDKIFKMRRDPTACLYADANDQESTKMYYIKERENC